MTAEVVVMNKMGIAAATDSAVTIPTKSGAKIYQSANKIFTISKYAPVGIMIYGSADIMNIPWEIIIKNYRARLGKKRFSYLKEYIDDFINFLEHNENLCSDKCSEMYVRQEIYSFLHFLRDEIRDELERRLGAKTPITESDITKAIELILIGKLESYRKYSAPKRLQKTFPNKVTKKYSKQITKILNLIFKKIPLSKKSMLIMHQMIGQLFYRQLIEESSYSGIVIMGYGEKENFPAATEYIVRGVVLNKLWCVQAKNGKIDIEQPSVIMAYAQQEMVNTFMEGIDPDYRIYIVNKFIKLLSTYAEELSKSIPGITEKRRQIIRKSLYKTFEKQLGIISQDFNKYQQENHVEKIMTMISVLPKNELAKVAETLVSLTSFKRRVSSESETVAEPIDVAVISKGDGLVWIKRKHYFPIDLNPTWPSRYLGEE
jgi:hypothetical protein